MSGEGRATNDNEPAALLAMRPASLETLCAAMQAETPGAPASAAWVSAGLPVNRQGRPAFALVPSFGGDEPAPAEEIWSWDEHRLLVGYGLATLEIIERGHFYRWLAGWRWGQR